MLANQTALVLIGYQYDYFSLDGIINAAAEPLRSKVRPVLEVNFRLVLPQGVSHNAGEYRRHVRHH